jgi:hypothetical protein
MSKTRKLSGLVSDGSPWSVLPQKAMLGHKCFGY